MDAKCREFIQRLGETGSIKACCASLGMCRRTYERWRSKDPEFASQCDFILGSNAAARKEKRMQQDNPGSSKADTSHEIRESSSKITGEKSWTFTERDRIAEELREAMRAAGTYGIQWEPQIALTAKAGAWLCQSELEIVEIGMEVSTTSREGNERLSVHPLHQFYLKQLERYQAGLRALGLNMDTKGEIKTHSNNRDKFFAELEDD